MENDLTVLMSILTRAGINFTVDKGEGWARRIVLPGDRALVFDRDLNLAGIRSHDDLQAFDD